MVTALAGSSSLGSSDGRVHCVVFLDKKLSPVLSLHPGVNGYRRKNAGGYPAMD